MRRFFIPLALALLLAGGCQAPPQASGEGHEEHAEHDHAATEKPGHEGHDHGPGEADSHDGELVSLTEEQAKIAQMEVTEARHSMAAEGLNVPGVISVISGRRVSVTPSAEGILTDLRAVLGQRVTQGQIIGTIESSSLADAFSRITEAEQAVAEGRAKVKDDEAQIKLAASRVASSLQALRRQRKLASAGAFSQAPLQAAQSELSDAESELLSLQKEEASHSDQLKRLESLFREGLIGRLELEAARLEVQQDAIKLARAKARVAQARDSLEREERIAAKGLLNSREVQGAEAEVQTARLELARAKSQLASSQNKVRIAEKALVNARGYYRSTSNGNGVSGGRASLRASITGIIAQLESAKGQAVDRTQSLMVIEDTRQVWATVSVPEKEVHRLKVGLTARVTSKTFAGDSFLGEVQVIGSSLDLRTRTLPVQILLDNPRGTLKPGMFVEAFLQLGGAENSLMIPKSALIEDEGKAFVFVKEADGFVRHEVKTGRQMDGQVQILSGLEEGDLIVSKGAFILKSQAKKGELKGHEH